MENNNHEEMLAIYASLDDTLITREHYVREPFSYAGNKFKSLEYILPLLPYGDSFIDVFGGSGAVMLNRRPSPLDVFNDRWSGVVAFFKCMRDSEKLDRLIEKLSLTLYSREEFLTASQTWESFQDDVERAARWYTTIQLSFGSLRRNFGRQLHGNFKLWTRIHQNIERFHDIHQRFKKIMIENLDWREALKDFDNPHAVFYLDPPYWGDNIYKHRMSKTDHIHMCERIFKCEGFVALSGFQNPEYDSFPWDAKHEWIIPETMTTQALKTETSNVKNAVRGVNEERLWIKEAYL